MIDRYEARENKIRYLLAVSRMKNNVCSVGQLQSTEKPVHLPRLIEYLFIYSAHIQQHINLWKLLSNKNLCTQFLKVLEICDRAWQRVSWHFRPNGTMDCSENGYVQYMRWVQLNLRYYDLESEFLSLGRFELRTWMYTNLWTETS